MRDAYARWIERFGRKPSPMEDDYVRLIADGQAWVLEVEGELVGLVVLKDRPEALMIPNVAVASSAQGKGHGRRLLAFAEQEAKRRGYGEISGAGLGVKTAGGRTVMSHAGKRRTGF